MSKKRKADADAEDSPPEKKLETEELAPGHIILKYQDKSFRAKLSNLRALCKHPSLDEENKEGFKAGDTWPIGVYLGTYEGLNAFLDAVADPFGFDTGSLTRTEDILSVGLCAHYFESPGLLKKISDRVITYWEFAPMKVKTVFHKGPVGLACASELSATPRKKENPVFALYCFGLCAVVSLMRQELNTLPADTSASSRVLWDCLRVLPAIRFDEMTVHVHLPAAMSILAEKK